MTKNELLEHIEIKRTELQNIVLKNGLDSHITILYSQELDQLLNQYDHSFLR